MSWWLVQAGSKIYGVGTDGSATEITLPDGVTIDTTRKLRAAALNRQVVIVNAPTVNLAIDANGNCRGLVPRAPAFPPNLAAGAGTGLSGLRKVRYTYAIKDRYGRVIAESPMSPVASITLTNTGLAVSNIRPSVESSVNCRIIYRTTDGGSVFFRWADLDDNLITSYDNNLGDAGLSLLATTSDDLGLPPGSAGGVRLRLITRWKNRLWVCSDDPADTDNIRFCEVDRPWAWPAANRRGIPPVGANSNGITALIPRRDDLGIAKVDSVSKIVGDSTTTFQTVIVSEGSGIVAPDSIAVIDDIGYGLGMDGVYQYDDSGFVRISETKNHPWFTTDDYFQRSMFPYAEGRWDPENGTYDLHLAAAGSSVLDRWISYDLQRKVFTGPHKTDAFTPKCSSLVTNSSGARQPVIGGNNGFVYLMNQAARRDGTSAIDARIQIVLPADTPDIEKMFLQPDIMARVETSAGRTLTITPTLGGMDDVAGTPMTAELSAGRQRLEYLGAGRILQLDIRNNTIDHDFLLYALEIPFFEVGRK